MRARLCAYPIDPMRDSFRHMTFRETLDKHLQAIAARDLDGLVETLPHDELVLVMSSGEVVRSVAEFVEAHRAWFQMPHWHLETEPIHVFETAELGVAVLKLNYSDLAPDHSRFHEQSVLTLIFAHRQDRWVMIHDQNTPIKPG